MLEKSIHNENERDLPTEIDKIIAEIVLRIKVLKQDNKYKNKKFYIRLYDNNTDDNKTYNPQNRQNATTIKDRLLERTDILLYNGKQESENSQFVSFYDLDF